MFIVQARNKYHQKAYSLLKKMIQIILWLHVNSQSYLFRKVSRVYQCWRGRDKQLARCENTKQLYNIYTLCATNVEYVVPAFYKCNTNVLYLMGDTNF